MSRLYVESRLLVESRLYEENFVCEIHSDTQCEKEIEGVQMLCCLLFMFNWYIPARTALSLFIIV